MFQDSGFNRVLCDAGWVSPSVDVNTFVNSKGRHGCCDAGSFMVNPFCPECPTQTRVASGSFNATDGGGSCLACPAGWIGNEDPNDDLSCTKCSIGKSSPAKGLSCNACGLGRTLVTKIPLDW